MNLLFKNILYFTLLYLVFFIVDTIVKVNIELTCLRYFTKSSLMLLLLLFYVVNQNEQYKSKMYLVVIAICCFIIGDFFIIDGKSKLFITVGAIFFAVAKILYTIRFSNNNDFNILRLIPFLLFCFAYMSLVMLFIYNNLGVYFFPVLVYLFIVMITAQFAYLRKNNVNITSYWLVIIGIVLSMFSDSITFLKEFYDPEIAYNEYTIMLFYGLSQYFIVVGLVKESTNFKKTKVNLS
ncbi:lysoplasmalogenase [uncultured Lacinutrix sp.]|uniref:lysoplasmalogenase n=1 Tax=uncultured Lacinutrix sp. TaxID=574032 RepID=UPI0026150C17|nr:lysoplasmalogenase [uncultured Lacinutrix sp.]